LALFFFWRELDIDREYLFVEYKRQGINVRAFTITYLLEDIPLWIKFAVALPSATLAGLWIRGLWKFRDSLWSAAVFLRGKRPFWLFITSMLVLAISQFGSLLSGH